MPRGASPDYSHGLFLASPPSWGAVLIVIFVCYAALCSLLRFRRLDGMRWRCNYPDRDSLSRMTNADAQALVFNFACLEFPLFYDLAVRSAFFRALTSDNICKLLVVSSDLRDERHIGKRYEDTEVVVASFILFPPDSPLLHRAVARINYLHDPYIKAGKILNEDLLYVLYLAMAEPARFVRLYEWRSLTEPELAALATLWKYVGEMMGIDYAEQLGKSEWKDGIEFMEDVTRWALGYEDNHMRPVPEVQHMGKMLVDLLMSAYPKAMRPLGYQMLTVLMRERMRYAFGITEPGIAVSALTYIVLLARRLVARYLLLPRVSPVRLVSGPDARTGRMHHNHYLQEPWYVPATIWSRWGPLTWFTRASGGTVPGDGPEMKPEGFLFEDIGPRNKMGKGLEESACMEEQVRGMATGKCPFAASV